ncbi:GroES-like zinc-binding alcohol dehydrogenase family protein [Gossypium australe]|uniref:GroES-like zinc-binding alcohol dehydrogenase family protein n=1 Tax=Gossypium australe TaxID=47621 RepID=A0A5B6V7U5_9ROSI|nr:GroES-like zinc-binding alcohol dehydrogenase family protein [Gossypium australe]
MLELDSYGANVDEDLELLEGDIHRSIVNGIPAINFSKRIQQILFKEMELTVVSKSLGRNIGYGALNIRISSLWNPSKPFHIMDIENGYFLAKFHSTDDYTKVLSQGPWLINGLPRFLYKKKILEEIGGIIGKVARLDFNIDSKIRGRFARMAVYINLDKPLIAQVLVNGMHQKVEYEALPTICFTCKKYGHTKEICASLQ